MPKKNSSPQTLRQQNRRFEFLDAARELFFLNGYRGTSMQQITNHAGYSKRTVYLDYQNKDDIFLHVAAEGLELLLEKLSSIPIKDLSVEDSIDRISKTLINFSRDYGPYFRIIFSEATPDIIANASDDVREKVQELERSCMAVVVSAFEKATRENLVPPMNPWEASAVFVGSATGIILLSMGGSQTVYSKATLESLVNKAVWTLWTGLRSLATVAQDSLVERETLKQWG